ncbi:MAG: hypothetical protein ACXAB2_07520, partial [Candidatus Hodarchaeales archaeon]
NQNIFLQYFHAFHVARMFSWGEEFGVKRIIGFNFLLSNVNLQNMVISFNYDEKIRNSPTPKERCEILLEVMTNKRRGRDLNPRVQIVHWLSSLSSEKEISRPAPYYRVK